MNLPHTPNMRYPTLFQVLTRDWLGGMPSANGRVRTLNEVPDDEIDRLADLGFDWLYLLGVWQTGKAGRQISLANPAWRPGYNRALSDFHEDDVTGSPFAVQSYAVHSHFGDDEALAQLRTRLEARGIRLMLDFVPNHLALDHPWAQDFPERFIRGTAEDLEREPLNFVRRGAQVFAHGRDPYFPGWVDTIQLDYSKDETRAGMSAELLKISRQCDGLRCDMAMLLLPDVFKRTWNFQALPFWPEAIRLVREAHPGFLMMAEVYWNLEWELQRRGFDFTYDKTLRDRLIGRDSGPVRDHLQADPAFQSKLARFLENHDEPRIAEELPVNEHKAAALIAYGVPGLRFFHDGQLQGATRKPSIHLGRREVEATNPEIASFYRMLLGELKNSAMSGEWRLLQPVPASEGNWTADSIIAFSWSRDRTLQTLVAVNLAAHRSQCQVRLEFYGKLAGEIGFTDAITGTKYFRLTREMEEPGLFIDLPAWGAHLFRVPASK